MFERFTERARQVVVLAQEEARGVELMHNYIGTEHLLLGLLREEQGIAARVLESFDLTVEAVRAQVLRRVGRGEEVTSGQIPFTPRAKAVLENADTEARKLQHNYIGTEHILLALGLDNRSVAAQILLDYDVTSERIHGKVARMMIGPTGRVRPGSGGETQRRPGGRFAGEQEEPGVTPPSAIDPGWLDGLPRGLISRLGTDIRSQLGRAPDVGDLLLVLACVADTPAAQALSLLGVDLDQLADGIERSRAADRTARDAFAQKILETVQAKERAIEEGRMQDAARLRDHERQQRDAMHAQQREQLAALGQLRTYLKLPDPGS